MNVAVSVVISTRNAGATIVRCLRSVRAQTISDIEIILVDNHSSDGTRELAAPYVDMLLVAGPERSAQRNYGITHCRGEYVLVIDADMELDPDVVASCLAAVDGGPTIVAIPEVSVGEGFWARCRTFERSFYTHDQTVSAARFFPAHVLREIGGYDEEMYAGEDWDITIRAERLARFRFAAGTIVHHEGRLGLWTIVGKKFYYARNLRVFLRKHGSTALARLSPARTAWLRQPAKLFADPCSLAGMVLMKGAELLAVVVGLAMPPRAL